MEDVVLYGKKFFNPAGMIIPTGWDGSAKSGWLYCDGSSVLIDDYPSLYAAIGTRFGQADATHFNIPDFRGRFLRGADDGAGNDPDAAGRTAMATGGNTGDNVGSVQADAFESHTHTQADGNAPSVAGSLTYNLSSVNIGGKFTTSASGGNETRPVNAAVAYYIKT
jgi:microcystin-dependent protein